MDPQEFSTQLLTTLTCPLSQKIFLNPILASDNNIYEASELETHISTHGYTSPLNPESIITSDYILVNPLKIFINELIEKIPTLSPHRYSNPISQLSYFLNRTTIISYINTQNYSELLKYTKYSLTNLGDKNLINILSNASDNVTLHIINNCININEFIPNTSYKCTWQLIHYAIFYATIPVIQYLISLNIDINSISQDDHKTTPLHLAFSNYNKDNNKISLLLENNADILIENSKNTTPLEYILQHTPKHIIQSIKLTPAISKIPINKLVSCLSANQQLSDYDIIDISESLQSIYP